MIGIKFKPGDFAFVTKKTRKPIKDNKWNFNEEIIAVGEILEYRKNSRYKVRVDNNTRYIKTQYLKNKTTDKQKLLKLCNNNPVIVAQWRMKLAKIEP